MSSKRDIRSYSTNGRSYSLDNNEEDEPPVRGESSRNYFLNVRPENRQTFCTIIAQITEETQPSFETTLKSHAVSEDTDVKFTCMVTGHPAPEITWYKDEMEMDRYCGLPKYQIFRYGKKHSLHLYKCTEDDAAIYQASARNNKGIVSCSGVLEVGTMNEYKIHQQWFARIKQKAETKRRGLEETRIRGKENMAHAANIQRRDLLRTVSPERAQRKRKSQVVANASPPDSSSSKEDVVKVRVPDPEAALHKNMAGMPRAVIKEPEVQNGYLPGPQGTELVTVKDGKPPVNNSQEDLVENGISFIDYIYEIADLVATRPTGKEFAAKKKKRKLSEEESEPMVVTAEDKSQGICDESALNGIDSSKDPGILAQCLSDTLKRNKSRGDPKSFKSGDYIEIDEQVSSVMLGQRQHSAVPSSPKIVRTGKEKDLSPLNCRSPKGTEPEVTKFTNDATIPIDQGPMYSSLQSPARDVYFSMKDMYFGTIQEPKKHKQPHLPQVTETIDEANPQLQGPINSQEALTSESVEVPYLMVAMPRCHPKQDKASEDLPNMETSSFEMDTALPCVHPEVQKGDTFDNNITDDIQQTTEVIESINSHEPSERGVSYVDLTGKGAEEDLNFPLCAVDTTPLPTFQPLHPSAVIQAEDKAKAVVPHMQGDPAEGPKSASPIQQLACETLPETVMCKEQAEPDVSPVPERAGDVCSVGAFNDEWEKLDFLNISDQNEISDEHPTSASTTSEVTEPELRDCPSEGMSPPQNDQETLPAAERRNQTTQTIFQQGLDLRADVEAMEVTTAASAADHAQIVEVPQTSREGPVPVENVPPEAKQVSTTAGQQVVTDTLAEGTFIELAVPFVEESVAEANATDEKAPEKMIAEIEGELLKIDSVEEAGPEEHVRREVSPDSFGAQIVEKFLSYLKIPSFLLGEKSPAVAARKPEATTNVSPAPELPSHNEDTSTLQPTKEVTDPYKSPPTAMESLLEKEVVQAPPKVLPANTENLHVTKEECASDRPLIGTDVHHVELNVMSLPTTVEESNTDTLNSASPLTKASVDPALPVVTPPSTPELDRTTGVSFTGETWTSLQPTTSVTALPLENLEVSHTELNITAAPKYPNVEGASTLPPTLDVKSLEDAEDGQGVTALSYTEGKTDKNTAPCLVDTVEDSRVMKEVTGDGSKLLEVTYIPSNETVSVPKPIIPSIEDVTSGSDLQVTKGSSDIQVPEISQVPSIVVDNITFKNTVTTSIEDNEPIKRDLPAVPLLQGSNAKIKLNDAPPIIPSATPAELASGARRKIFLPRSKQLDDSEVTASDVLNLPTQPKKEEGVKRIQHTQGDAGHTEEESSLFPLSPRRSAALLQASAVQQTVPAERRSPTVARKMSTLEVPKLYEEPADKSGASPLTKGETAKDSKSASVKSEVKTEEVKSTKNPFKAPQVIRKIRAEQFSDASGNLKLWCQFFNLLSDSTVRWHKDGLHLDKLKRSAGDESQLALAIVQASAKDCGVYRCVVENEYGSDATDFLFSNEVLSGFISREEIEVGEEIEMMPMLITKGLTDAGFWGNKLFGRIMIKELNFGDGFRRKASRVKVIYGLEPIFESGATCIIKVRNCISYGTKRENGLIESNHDITLQECKLQNTAREYGKIFAAEARVIEDFGPVPEIIPLHLLYRPANNIPYATIEKDLNGQFMKYCMEDKSKNLPEKSGSEIEQKCHTFQHWIYQWTNGNLLITDLQGVGLKITDVQIATNSKGYQGLTGNCSSSVIEEFATAHQCNRHCEALGLKSLKSIDNLQPFKPKTSKSPLMTRKAHSTQSSPQVQRKGQSSPQVQRKGQSSPLVQRKGQSSPQAPRKSATSPNTVRRAGNAEDAQQTIKHRTVEIPKSVKLR
ncbi:alpha-protein kinase 3 [Heptranchias perlo]|uniref:alpha-protein kinase 3 n=1 Tax=Heptranchias perlo TaxID=212740 RepID=UPI0035594E6E